MAKPPVGLTIDQRNPLEKPEMTNKIRAVFSDKPAENARTSDTPMVSVWSLVVKHKGELREAVTVRTYYTSRGTGMQPVRACIWVRGAEGYRSGRGSAGGCGYHKESAAIADAVSNAGITLYGNPYARDPNPADAKKPLHFGGTGSSAYREIFEAIARAAGYRIGKGGALMISH